MSHDHFGNSDLSNNVTNAKNLVDFVYDTVVITDLDDIDKWDYLKLQMFIKHCRERMDHIESNLERKVKEAL